MSVPEWNPVPILKDPANREAPVSMRQLKELVSCESLLNAMTHWSHLAY